MALAQTSLRKIFQLVGQDSATLIDIINSFLEETPTLVAQLSDAVQHQNVAAAGMAAHGLKSTSLDMGAIIFSNMCRDIEVGCRVHAALPTALELKQLVKEAKEVTAVLQQTVQAITEGTWNYEY